MNNSSSTVVSPAARPHPERFRSKTLTAALALFFGSIGAHRFYLYGSRDKYAWAHILGLLVGGFGYFLLYATERESITGWILVLALAATFLGAFLGAIVYGLRPDEKWDAQFNSTTGESSDSGWTVVFIVMISLFVGAGFLMAGLAVAFQTYFEATKVLTQ